jgi:hypothetical protein
VTTTSLSTKEKSRKQVGKENSISCGICGRVDGKCTLSGKASFP